MQVNYGACGVYRVHYDHAMLEALLPAIQDKSLSTVDRFMLHSDLVALVSTRFIIVISIINIIDLPSSF